MIILVRHGEATHHTLKLTGGWTDSDLTEKGRWQIEMAAKKLAADFAGKNTKLRILTSDLKRAVESAEIIGKALGCADKIEKYAFLREKNNGEAAGLTEEEAKKIYCRPATEQELNHRNYPGGETRIEFYKRNVHGLIEKADLDRENLIIVAH
ncbi:MAG: histidine phosphatase family protein, partial [Phascolarctobacterium sp.]|nr:histidine phosphatase family protein [Phascolarctobacterium sp.]